MAVASLRYFYLHCGWHGSVSVARRQVVILVAGRVWCREEVHHVGALSDGRQMLNMSRMRIDRGKVRNFTISNISVSGEIF